MTNDMFKREEMKKSFWKSLALQGCNTYARQQGLGFGYAMIPFLKELYKDDPKEYADSLLRHTELFNITPQLGTFVMGISMAMEEEARNNPDFDRGSISAIKTALMGPLSGFGDAILWGSWRTISIGIGLGFAAQGSVFGAIIFVVLFNAVAWAMRYIGYGLGYHKGMEFIASATEGGLLENFTVAAKILGATVVGYMICKTVGFTTTISFTFDGWTTSLQEDIFDAFMPKILPLVLCFVTYNYVRKGKNTTTILLGLVIFAFALAIIESLPIFGG